MTAQHGMTTAHPLACNCKPGWVSTFFLPTRTHPLACNCETGWVFFLLFCRSTNDDNNNPPPRLQLRDGVGFFIFFFKSTNANDDDEPCRLVVIICSLPPSA